jgi:hypothetical protein
MGPVLTANVEETSRRRRDALVCGPVSVSSPLVPRRLNSISYEVGPIGVRIGPPARPSDWFPGLPWCLAGIFGTAGRSKNSASSDTTPRHGCAAVATPIWTATEAPRPDFTRRRGKCRNGSSTCA